MPARAAPSTPSRATNTAAADDERDESQRVPAEVGFGGLLRRLDLAGALARHRAARRSRAQRPTTITTMAVAPRIRGKKPGPIRPAAVRHSMPIAISV